MEIAQWHVQCRFLFTDLHDPQDWRKPMTKEERNIIVPAAKSSPWNFRACSRRQLLKDEVKNQMSKLQRRRQSTMVSKERPTRGAGKGLKLLSGTRDQLIKDLQRIHKLFPTAVPDRDFYR
jgi:hypothetical protein